MASNYPRMCTSFLYLFIYLFKFLSQIYLRVLYERSFKYSRRRLWGHGGLVPSPKFLQRIVKNALKLLKFTHVTDSLLKWPHFCVNFKTLILRDVKALLYYQAVSSDRDDLAAWSRGLSQLLPKESVAGWLLFEGLQIWANSKTCAGSSSFSAVYSTVCWCVRAFTLTVSWWIDVPLDVLARLWVADRRPGKRRMKLAPSRIASWRHLVVYGEICGACVRRWICPRAADRILLGSIAMRVSARWHIGAFFTSLKLFSCCCWICHIVRWSVSVPAGVFVGQTDSGM